VVAIRALHASAGGSASFVQGLTDKPAILRDAPADAQVTAVEGTLVVAMVS